MNWYVCVTIKLHRKTMSWMTSFVPSRPLRIDFKEVLTVRNALSRLGLKTDESTSRLRFLPIAVKPAFMIFKGVRILLVCSRVPLRFRWGTPTEDPEFWFGENLVESTLANIRIPHNSLTLSKIESWCLAVQITFMGFISHHENGIFAFHAPIFHTLFILVKICKILVYSPYW